MTLKEAIVTLRRRIGSPVEIKTAGVIAPSKVNLVEIHFTAPDQERYGVAHAGDAFQSFVGIDKVSCDPRCIQADAVLSAAKPGEIEATLDGLNALGASSNS